jgi:hypothetical protein
VANKAKPARLRIRQCGHPEPLVSRPASFLGKLKRGLIERYGIDAKLFDWSDEITADCPRKQARNLNDQCGARCPDLPKVM